MAIQYYMRGYNTSAPGTIGYVDWVVNDTPDSTAAYVPAPYLAINITNITVNRIVPSKVDNFLKPFESLTAINAGSGSDGYFLHINSYDWLNHTPPNTTVPIPVPSYMTGLSVVRGTTDGYTPRDYATLFWQEGLGQFKFAFNTNGDDVTVGTALPVSMGSLAIDGYLSVGTNPAQSGIIRIPNSQYIVARNSTNTGDVPLIEADNVNRITIGSGGSAPVYMPGNLRVDGYIRDPAALPALSGFIRAGNGTTAVTFRDSTNSNDLPAVSSTGNIILIGSSIGGGTRHNASSGGFVHAFQINGVSDVEIGDSFIRFTNTVSFPTITQTTATSGNGQNLLVKAQSSSFGSSAGGSLILDTGHGLSTDGYVDLRVNNLPKVRVFGPVVPVTADFNDNSGSNPNSIQLFNPIIRWYDTVANPVIIQDQVNTGVDGQTFLIAAQTATGVTNKGGDITISSGSSNAHVKDGYVRLQTGFGTRLILDPTASRATLTFPTFSFNGSDNTFDSNPVVNPTINQRNDTNNGVTGQLFTIKSQTTTGTSSIGGSMNIGSGNGTLADGYVRIVTGSTTRMFYDATANRATITLSTFAFNGLDGGPDQVNVLNPTIKQRDNVTPSATGQTLTIQAQSAPVGGVGGNLVLASGLGATLAQDGYISFRTDSLTAGGKFFTDANGPFFSVGDSVASPAATDGYFRVPNNVLALAARNSINSANIRLAGTNSSNQILLGNGSDNTGFVFSAAVNSIYDFQINNVGNKVAVGDGYIRFGSIPALASGLVRAPNAVTILTARNNLNTLDIPVIGTDASNNVVLGGAVNNVTIPGNLTVNGTTTTVNSTVVDIADRVIHVNASTGIVGVPSQIAGFSVHRGSPDGITDRDHAALVWNEFDGYWKFAFNTVGNDLTLNSTLPIMTAGVVVLPTGTGNIATVGGLRVPNNTTAVAAPNFNNNANLLLVGTDANDRILFGSPAATSHIFNTAVGSVYDFQYNSVSNKVMIGDGYVRFGAVPSLIGNLRSSQTSTVATDIVTARKADNTNDLKLLGVDGYDRITYGSSALNTGHTFNTAAAGTYDIQVNSVSVATIDANKFIFKKGRRRAVTSVTGTYPVVVTDDYLAITTLAAPFTITLPAGPTLGDTYEIKDTVGNAGVNNVTISGNGANIDGAATILLSQNYASFVVTYTGTQWSVS